MIFGDEVTSNTVIQCRFGPDYYFLFLMVT